MKILIIEDEIEIATSIKNYLSSNDFVCESASTLKIAIEKIDLYSYDCILLDLMLTDGDGFKILEILKSQNKTDGVIIISAKDTLETKIEGLTLGADDYLTKPFHLSELLVRIQALVRRKQFNGNNVVSFHEIEIDTISKSVKIKGNKIEFTKKEMDLLLMTSLTTVWLLLKKIKIHLFSYIYPIIRPTALCKCLKNGGSNMKISR